MDWALHVLDRVLAHVFERVRHLAGNVIPDRGRNRDQSDRRDCLQPRSDVDAIAVDVLAFNDDVAEIDADAVAKLFFARAPCVGGLGCFLDRERAVDRVDDAPEFDERPVADQLDEAAAMRSDTRIEDAPSIGLEPFERAGLVDLHQVAEVGDVG